MSMSRTVHLASRYIKIENEQEFLDIQYDVMFILISVNYVINLHNNYLLHTQTVNHKLTFIALFSCFLLTFTQLKSRTKYQLTI